MSAADLLRSLGVDVIVPHEPVAGWRSALLETGKYNRRKVAFLLEGEGVSAYATQVQGMVSCRARVELRLIAVPGRSVSLVEKGVGARVDLLEALAAKSALEDAAHNATVALLGRLNQLQKKKGR